MTFFPSYKIPYVRSIEMTELPFSMRKCIMKHISKTRGFQKFRSKVDHDNKDRRVGEICGFQIFNLVRDFVCH